MFLFQIQIWWCERWTQRVSTFLGRVAVVKEQFSKQYRHPILDAKFTQKRLASVFVCMHVFVCALKLFVSHGRRLWIRQGEGFARSGLRPSYIQTQSVNEHVFTCTISLQIGHCARSVTRFTAV